MPAPRPSTRLWRNLSRAAFLVALAGATAVGCGSDDPGPDASPGSGASDGSVIRVGPDEEHATVQAGVDAASPGDMVLIAPGTYAEEVEVTTERLVIRGEDRNAVVLDGEDRLLHGIRVTADQVAVENLTVKRFAINGVFFTGSYEGSAQDGPVGWRASYVTAVNNGLYGLYAFGTGPGGFDNSYASGHPDSGFYVGQCRDCGAVLVDNVAERNAIGFENTNASGVTLAGNIARHNRVGITIASSVTEQLAPQVGSEVVGNLIEANAEPQTPETRGAFGVGIAIAGGTANIIRDNVIRDHPNAGVVIVDQDGFAPTGNEVLGNEMTDNGTDVVLAAEDGGSPTVTGTCIEGNAGASTRPAAAAEQLACERAEDPDLGPSPVEPVDAPPGVSPREVEMPGDQPQRPDPADGPWELPGREPEEIDLESVPIPAG